MKKILFLILLVCFLSCDNTQNSSNPAGFYNNSNNAGSVLKKEQNEDVQGYLTRIGKAMAKDTRWLNDKLWGKLANLESVPLSQIDLPFLINDATLNEKDGLFEIKIELYYDGKPAKKSVKEIDEFRITLDPDLFFSNNEIDDYLYEKSVPTFSNKKSNAENIEIGLETPLEFPLFLITIEEKWPEHLTKTAGIAATPGTYLAFYSLTLRTKKDDSDEEFEAYLSNCVDDDESCPFPLNTSQVFDGSSRNDAANQYVQYPDVNGKATYTVSGGVPICLKSLGGTAYRLIAMDDDITKGHVRFDTGGNLYHMSGLSYYNVATDLRNDNGSSWFNFTRRDGEWDDVYKKTGVTEINLANVNDKIDAYNRFNTDDAINGPLPDIKWVLEKKVY